MVELETHELEYFIAVADELHFGRAAVRLSIAQPALSKAIQRIETRLGVRLFLRSSRHVELTPAGKRCRSTDGTRSTRSVPPSGTPSAPGTAEPGRRSW